MAIISNIIYMPILKPKNLSGTYFKPSARALKYGKNQQKMTKIAFLKTSKDRL